MHTNYIMQPPTGPATVTWYKVTQVCSADEQTLLRSAWSIHFVIAEMYILSDLSMFSMLSSRSNPRLVNICIYKNLFSKQKTADDTFQ